MSKTLTKQNSTDLPNISFDSLVELVRKKQDSSRDQSLQRNLLSEDAFLWIGFYAWIPFIIVFPLNSMLTYLLLIVCVTLGADIIVKDGILRRLVSMCVPHFFLLFECILIYQNNQKYHQTGCEDPCWLHPLSPLGFVMWVRRKMVRSLSTDRLTNNPKTSSHMSAEVLKLLPSVFDEVCKDEEHRIMCALRGDGGLKDKLNAQIQKSLEQRAYWGMRDEQEQGKNPQVAKTLAQTLEISERLSAHRERLEKVEAQITTMFAQFRARFAGIQTHVQDTLQLQGLAQLEAEVSETQSQIEETICGIVTEVTVSMMRLRDQLNECLAQSTVNVAGSLPSTGNANQDLAYIDQTINSLVQLKLDQVEPEIG